MGAAAAAAAAGAAGAASGASSQSQSRNHSEILKQELLNDRRVILQHEQELQQLREERAQRQQQPSRQPSQPPDPNDNMNDNNNNNSNSNRNVDRSHSPRRNSSSSAKRGKKSKQKRPNRNPRKRSGLPAHLQLIHERIENLKRETADAWAIAAKLDEGQSITDEERALADKRETNGKILEELESLYASLTTPEMMRKAIEAEEPPRPRPARIPVASRLRQDETVSLLHFFYMVRLVQQGFFQFITSKYPALDGMALVRLADRMVGAALRCTKSADDEVTVRQANEAITLARKLHSGAREPIEHGSSTTFQQLHDLIRTLVDQAVSQPHSSENTASEGQWSLAPPGVSPAFPPPPVWLVVPYNSMMDPRMLDPSLTTSLDVAATAAAPPPSSTAPSSSTTSFPPTTESEPNVQEAPSSSAPGTPQETKQGSPAPAPYTWGESETADKEPLADADVEESRSAPADNASDGADTGDASDGTGSVTEHASDYSRHASDDDHHWRNRSQRHRPPRSRGGRGRGGRGGGSGSSAPGSTSSRGSRGGSGGSGYRGGAGGGSGRRSYFSGERSSSGARSATGSSSNTGGGEGWGSR